MADSSSGGALDPHQMIVNKVTTALLSPSSPSDESDEDMSSSDEDDGSISKYEKPEEPDDSMTLDEYHNGLQKEALARKVSQNLVTSHKKGRMEKGDDDL